MLTALIAVGCVAAYLLIGAVTAGLLLRITATCELCDRYGTWEGCGPHHCAGAAVVLWPLYVASIIGWRFVLVPLAAWLSGIALAVAGHQPKHLRGEALQRRIAQLEREVELR